MYEPLGIGKVYFRYNESEGEVSADQSVTQTPYNIFHNSKARGFTSAGNQSLYSYWRLTVMTIANFYKTGLCLEFRVNPIPILCRNFFTILLFSRLLRARTFLR